MESGRFREFWGAKSELRRFKDGNIVETLVWDEEEEDAALVLSQILSHVFSLHAPFTKTASSKLNILGLGLHANLGSKNLVKFRECMNVFDSLAKALVGMEDLSLRVSSVRGIAPELRYASAKVTEKHPFAMDVSSQTVASLHVPVMKAVLEMESSTRWPSDLASIRAMVSDFFHFVFLCVSVKVVLYVMSLYLCLEEMYTTKQLTQLLAASINDGHCECARKGRTGSVRD